MLRFFFSLEHKDKASLFHGLNIWHAGQEYLDHQGRYPTIFLTLKNNKAEIYDSAYKIFKESIAEIYRHFGYLLSSPLLDQEEKLQCEAIKTERAPEDKYQSSLYKLSEYLHRFHKVPVVLLIDEYDTPLQSAFLNSYWREMSSLMRGLFGFALKDNPHLYKGVVTGITRIAKENLFSGINNLSVYSILDEQYSQYFGLTEDEILWALKTFGLEERHQTVREWYNGYIFGHSTELYNPWSVANFLARKVAEPYWANTSDNALIKKYAREMPADGKQQLERLIRGEEIEAQIEKYMVYSDLDQDGSVDRMWNLFLISGYLKCTGQIKDSLFRLKIPNQEVLIIFEKLVREWFEISAVQSVFLEFIRALISGEVSLLEGHLGLIVEQTFSNFETGFNQAESFYHAFFLGMLMNLRDRYVIHSNKESGYGRYDVCLEPMDKTALGYIIEFKAFHKRLGHKSFKQVGNEALQQIEDRKYDTELVVRGIQRIKKLAIVFKGKQVKIFEGKERI
jgi:hypothetical protein